jgi:hypothetical protein
MLPCRRLSPDKYSDGVTPEPRYQLTWMVKPRQVSEFGEHSNGRGELHTAHELQA